MPDSVDASPRKGSRTSDYDYALPEGRIAQRPAEPRDTSRMLVVDRRDGSIAHRTFRDIAGLIPAGDAIVVNTTKVFRARLLGQRENGGPAEILLLRPVDGDHFEAMIHPGGKLRPGRVVTIAPDFRVEIVETTPRRTRIVRLHTNGDVAGAIEQYGHVPLPPYIERDDESGDIARYQTVYADTVGSVAAPTAGLHFTPDLLDTLRTALESTHDNKERVHGAVSAYFAFVDDPDGAYRLVFESDLTNEPAVRARVEGADSNCASLLSRVIAEDTGLSDSQAHLLASGLLGMAQIAARRWMRDADSLSRDSAVDLISSLGWRGIRGFPLSHPPQA